MQAISKAEKKNSVKAVALIDRLTLVLVESEGTLEIEEPVLVSALGFLRSVIARYRCKSLSLDTYGKYWRTAFPLGPAKNLEINLFRFYCCYVLQ